ncbi:hypothetical protein Salat_2441500 [Sesamum alatum]|uniref:C3H1-type domain-containing protein n=1 Tax=Sesamum alatum TaxID=300844 RepID=A0AAE1XZ23_9LAMI|nr:hypothetical protein Salat_2441500 [Sesamum alatum]
MQERKNCANGDKCPIIHPRHRANKKGNRFHSPSKGGRRGWLLLLNLYSMGVVLASRGALPGWGQGGRLFGRFLDRFLSTSMVAEEAVGGKTCISSIMSEGRLPSPPR